MKSTGKMSKVLVGGLVLVVSALVGSAGPAAAQSGTWATKTSMPTPRTLHVLGAVNGKLYATGGGFNLAVEEYDPVTDTWATKTSMPGPASNSFAGGVVNGKIYVMGGGVVPGVFLSTVQEYDPATDTWTTKASMPTGRFGLGVAVVNDELYAIGGSNGFVFTPVVEKYNPATNTWVTIAGSEMPTPRQNFAVAVLGGQIFTMGGFINNATVEAYDPGTNTWTTKASLPTGKYCLGAATLGGKIYAIGGSPGGTTTLAENHVYDPGTNAWSAETSMPTARACMGVEVIGDNIHVVGGLPDMATSLGTHEVFTPAAAVPSPTDILVADGSAFGGLGGVIRVNPTTGAQTAVSSAGLFVDPVGIAVAASGDILVADANAFGGLGGVIRVNPTTGAQTMVSSGGNFVDPHGIAIEASGQLVVADPSADKVIRVDPATGAQSIVSSGGVFQHPVGIAVAADGSIIVADVNAGGVSPFNVITGGAVIRVHPVTGVQTVISSGGSFYDPQGVALDAAGQILVADHNSLVGGGDGLGGGKGAIFRINPSTGAQTVVSTGGGFRAPGFVAVEVDGNILVTDGTAFFPALVPTLFRINPASGAQTVLSSGGLFVAPGGIAIGPAAPAPNTPVGMNIDVQPLDTTTGTSPVTLTFANVTQDGTTSLTTSSSGPPPPLGFKLGTPPTYYELTTTAIFTGAVTVCIDYSAVSFKSESKLKLFHFEGGAWVNRTVSLDTTNDIICASVTSFSTFAIFEIEAPVGNAGADQTVNEGILVTLDGSMSTGLGLNFIWQQIAGPPVGLGGGTTATPTFISPLLAGGFGSQTLTFELTVSNDAGTSSDIVNITVVNVNHPPVAETGADQTVNEGSVVILSGASSFDPDNDSIQYQWLQTGGAAVALLGANTSTATFTAPLVGQTGAILTFELAVTDGALSAIDVVKVFVENINHSPVANAGADQTRNEGSAVTLDGAGTSDPDGDTLTYTWTQLAGPIITLSGAQTPMPTFTAPSVGPGGATLVFQLVVHDGLAASAPDDVTITVLNVNDPPACELAQANPALLWPPNHKMVLVGIVGVADPNSDQVTITITGVTQDELVNGLGDGDTSPDAVIQGGKVILRAERSGKGNGRVYRVYFTANDSQGGICTGSASVGVPVSMKPGLSGVDDGQLYDSTQP